MSLILVAGEPDAGATTVAVGLAQRLAYAGRSVRIARIEGDERAAPDAAVFASLEFADGADAPVASGAVTATDDGVTIAEAPYGADAAALAGRLGARLVTAVRANGNGAPVATDGALAIATHAREAGPLRLAEDRLLAAPTVAQLIEGSRAKVLARSTEGDAAVCEHIVIGAIAADSAEPYFRRFARTAVVTRAEKVDVALAALQTDPECLILTGGADPSPYILDRVASARSTTVLLAPEGTVETVRQIEGSFGRAPFSGAAKVERAGELMAAALDDDAVAGLLAG